MEFPEKTSQNSVKLSKMAEIEERNPVVVFFFFSWNR